MCPSNLYLPRDTGSSSSICKHHSKGWCARGSLLPQHAPAAHSRSKAPSSAPTISSKKICCTTKNLFPSFAPSYQTGLIWENKLQGQICCTILFQEQAPLCVPILLCMIVFQEQVPSCVLVGVLTRERVSGACFRSKLLRVYWLGYLPRSMFRECVSGVCFRSKLPHVYMYQP